MQFEEQREKRRKRSEYSLRKKKFCFIKKIPTEILQVEIG